MELHDERTVSDSVAQLDDGAREELVELVGGVHAVACLDSLVDLTGLAPEHLAAVAPFHELYSGCPTVEAAGLAALFSPLELLAVAIAEPTG